MVGHRLAWSLCALLLGTVAANFSSINASFLDLHGKINNFTVWNGSLHWCVETHCYQPKSLLVDFNSSLEGCKYRLTGSLVESTTSKPSVTKLDLTSLKLPAHIGPLVFRDGLVAQPVNPIGHAGHPVPHMVVRRLEAPELVAKFDGPLQRLQLRSLSQLAKEAHMATAGTALDELVADAETPDVMVGEDEGLSFPVPLQADGNVVIALNWTNATEPCVAVVARPEDCNTCSFGLDSCRAKSHLHGPDQETLLMYELPRQPFMLTNDLNERHEHSVCIRELQNGTVPVFRLLGRISYYRKPQVSFIKNILIIGVRTFINPGWNQEIVLQCTNCSAASQVVVQPITYDSRCRSVTQQMMAALAVANRHQEMPSSVDTSELRNSQMEEAAQHGTMAGINCPVPSSSPCAGYADGAFAVGFRKSTDYDDQYATFLLESSRRLSGHEKQIFFHHRSAICLYPGGPAAHGWLVGFAVVHMNVLDMQAFIGFVCFFGVALPLICLVTALLHYNKYERCKHHVRQLRLEYQREQLERELAAGEEEVETGLPRQRSGSLSGNLSGNLSASSRDAGPVATPSRAAPETNYQVLSGEPRPSTSSAFLRPS